MEPISAAEAKLHLRIDAADEDTLISALITAARVYCEGIQNRAYITQTLELSIDGFPWGRLIELPRPILQSVTSVKYTDVDGVEATFTDYVVDADSYLGRIALKRDFNWPTVTLREIGAIKIQFVAGYGATAASVPAIVKQAMLLLIAYWYENREAATFKVSHEMEFAVKALLNMDRVVPL